MGMPVLRRTKQRKILRKLRHPQACSQLRLYKLRVETLGGTGYAEILPGVRQAASVNHEAQGAHCCSGCACIPADFGLLGCGESEKFTADDLVLIHAVYYGTERNPVYCFALKKEENGWLFSADCLVGEQKEHYASFESFPIPAEDAAGFLQIISEDGEIKKLYRHRNPIRFFTYLTYRHAAWE